MRNTPAISIHLMFILIIVTLEQESLVEMRLRHLEAGQGIQDGAIQDLGDVVSGLAEAQGVSL